MGHDDDGDRPGAGLLPALITAGAMAAAAVGAVRGRRDTARPSDPAPADDVLTAGPAAEEPEGRFAPLLARLDRFQRPRPLVAFPLAVVKKFGEDKAGYLAALVAYFGFFSIFPLMLAFTSILGFVVTDPDEQREFSDAAADQIPVVGDTIRDTAGQLEGSVIAIAVGVVVALWAGLRIVDAMQNAMNDVWDLPRTARPNLVKRRVKGVAMLALIGGGLIGSVAASSVASLVDGIPGAGRFGIWAATAAVSVLLYLLSYQLLTDAKLPWRDLWPGAVVGGLAWWALQTFGSAYIVRQQESAGETYGEFAAIIALMAFFFVAAQLSILGAEISVVKSRRLWPRSYAKGSFTEADVAAFGHLANATVQDEHYAVRLEPHRTAPDGAAR